MIIIILLLKSKAVNVKCLTLNFSFSSCMLLLIEVTHTRCFGICDTFLLFMAVKVHFLFVFLLPFADEALSEVYFKVIALSILIHVR